MRIYDRYANLWPKYNDAHVRELLAAENLAVARFEPVYSSRPEAFLDLAFECDGRWLIVPLIRIDGMAAMLPTAPPVTWPAAYAQYSDAATSAIEDEVVPWLQSLTIARLVNDEAIRYFRDDSQTRAEFHAAREARWFGAAPYADVLATVGPAVYAQRFARDRSVALRGRDAANGAAVLSNVARLTDFDLGDAERNDAARRWFAGLASLSTASTASFDVYVGPRECRLPAATTVFFGEASADERTVRIVKPIPTEVTVSFDPEDAPVARTCAVSAPAVPVRNSTISEPAAGGGSGGRIRLVVRDDGFRFSGADVDAARTLAVRLCAEGFDARVSTAKDVDVKTADLIHVFDLRHGIPMVELLRDAEAARVPVVLTPYADDRKDEAIAGCSGAALLPTNANDVVAFEELLWAFARRKISGLAAGSWYDDVAQVLFARAASAIVSSAAEAGYLSTRFGYAGPTATVPAIIPSGGGAADIAALTGPDEYVLIHAAIEPRFNQMLAICAARRANLPLVLLGPVTDVGFYRLVNEAAGPNVIQLRDADLTEAEISALYRRARVVADVSWSSHGLHRLARGASSGAAVVAPMNGYAYDLWGEMTSMADPADIDSIERAFRRAWEQQPQLGAAFADRTSELCDPFAGLVAVVSAYQQASAVPA